MEEIDISKKIHDLRIQNNLTLEQVAQQVGVGKSTVRKWEVGQIKNMRRDKIAKLATALHTTPAYLMGWTQSDQTEEYESRKIFQKQLNELMANTNTNQVDIAKITGASTSTVSTWCNGINIPRMDKIERLASHFGLPVSYFLEEQSKKPDSNDGTGLKSEIMGMVNQLTDAEQAMLIAQLKGLLANRE
jgi:transcriptional regulator with XRE-family HTH domain